MPNHGSKYDKPVGSNKLEPINDIELEFHEAYKKFWAKRGVNVEDNKRDLPKENWKLSDPFSDDYVRLNKAIEYGRSYRKDAK